MGTSTSGDLNTTTPTATSTPTPDEIVQADTAPPPAGSVQIGCAVSLSDPDSRRVSALVQPAAGWTVDRIR
ncbi:MAG: hypothetical protein R2855_09755 [Thermomicrobiales bacterium]